MLLNVFNVFYIQLLLEVFVLFTIIKIYLPWRVFLDYFTLNLNYREENVTDIFLSFQTFYQPNN